MIEPKLKDQKDNTKKNNKIIFMIEPKLKDQKDNTNKNNKDNFND